jgi:hypothetical protein
MSKYRLIRSIMESQGSRICAVTFVKKDGSVRHMLVQYAATATHMKGDEAPLYKQAAAAVRRGNYPNLLNVWDIQSHGFRSINMDTITEIKGQGRTLYAG